MEYSTEGKMFCIGRWKVGLFGFERIKTLRGQLSDCMNIISIAFSTARVYFAPAAQVYLSQSDRPQHYVFRTGVPDARDEGHDAPTQWSCHSAEDHMGRSSEKRYRFDRAANFCN